VEHTTDNYVTEGVAEYVLTLFDKDFKGICIDIGAYHSTWLSNSYILEQLGWQVFCIEPNPYCIEGLSKRANVFQYAVGSKNKDNVDFYIYRWGHGPTGEAGGTGLFNQTHMKNSLVACVKVDVRTLDWFIENIAKINHIDFLSIDVELSEMEVLYGADLDKWKVKVIAIENLYETPEHGDAIITYTHDVQFKHLTQRGFKKINRFMYNDIYIREG